jgi:hypothetical protein
VHRPQSHWTIGDRWHVGSNPTLSAHQRFRRSDPVLMACSSADLTVSESSGVQ